MQLIKEKSRFIFIYYLKKRKKKFFATSFLKHLHKYTITLFKATILFHIQAFFALNKLAKKEKRKRKIYQNYCRRKLQIKTVDKKYVNKKCEKMNFYCFKPVILKRNVKKHLQKLK